MFQPVQYNEHYCSQRKLNAPQQLLDSTCIFQILVVTCLVVTSLGDTTLSDSFTAPAAPKTFYNAPAPSYSAPSYSAPSSSYGSPGVQTVQVSLI